MLTFGPSRTTPATKRFSNVKFHASECTDSFSQRYSSRESGLTAALSNDRAHA